MRDGTLTPGRELDRQARDGSAAARGPLSAAATALLAGLVHLYRWFLSPWLGGHCRFHPSCSDYALQALAAHGPLRGGWLMLRRLGRCHPFGGSGWDPVPPGRPAPTTRRAGHDKAPRNGPQGLASAAASGQREADPTARTAIRFRAPPFEPGASGPLAQDRPGPGAHRSPGR